MKDAVQCLVVVLTNVLVTADSNFLTGANDIVACKRDDGDVYATPFNVQFGKKDIWLPRSGHTVSLKVNGEMNPLSMTLDNEGRGYFSTIQTVQSRYRFWSALFGVSDPLPNQKTDTATSDQINKLDLQPGANTIEFVVQTASGSQVSTSAYIFYINCTQKIVVSDIDGTITRSNVRGLVLPVLGLSDWKHEGVVELYSKIAERGYMMMYLSARAIGQSESTRNYIYSLREDGYEMPRGPIFLHVDSLVNAFATEVIEGNPDVQKIAKMARLRGVLGGNPFFAAYGNKQTDITAYKALNIPEDKIFRVNRESLLTMESGGTTFNYTEHINDVDSIYPDLFNL